MTLRTLNGYDFFEVSSSMQKAIRRNDVKLAGYFALELWHSNYANYVWKRLYTISAEDCHGIITKEIAALYEGHQLVNQNSKKPKGRIFVSKAVMILCACDKNRDPDHLQNYIYDKKFGVSDEDIEKYFDDVRKNPLPIPEYAYDVHTKAGRKKGKTKAHFFKDELEALVPRQKGLFDDVI
jgi:replication-associated recombination protein RarA